MKQTETKTVNIGDYEFYIRPFPAFTAAKVSAKVISALSPVAGILTALVGENSGGLMNIDVSKIAPALSAINGVAVENTLKELILNYGLISAKKIQNLNEDTIKSDGKVQKLNEDLANEIFCQELEKMLELAFEVIKVNFPNIFDKLKNLSGEPNLSLTGEKKAE
jgi:hypothetical protein